MAVHHIRRRHHIGAGSGLADRGFAQRFEGFFPVDIAVFLKEAAMPIAFVLAQAHIANHVHVGIDFLDFAHAPLHDAVVGKSRSRFSVFFIGNAEEQHIAHALGF